MVSSWLENFNFDSSSDKNKKSSEEVEGTQISEIRLQEALKLEKTPLKTLSQTWSLEWLQSELHNKEDPI